MMKAEATPKGRGRTGPATLAGLALMAAAIVGLAAVPALATSARLTLGTTAISFPPADPDTMPTITASQNPVEVSVVVKGSASVISQLTVTSNGQLVSGSNSIPINRVSWIAQGAGFVSGAMSSTTPQPVGQWIGNVSVTGSLNFSLQNSWAYAVGNYSQSVVYTLVAY